MDDGDLLRDLSIDGLSKPSDIEEMFLYYVDMDSSKPGFTLTLLRRMTTLSLEIEGTAGAKERLRRVLPFCVHEHVKRCLVDWMEKPTPQRNQTPLILNSDRFRELLEREINRLHTSPKIISNTVLVYEILALNC